MDINAATSRWFRPEELQAEGSVVKYARHCLRHANSCADALEGIAKFDRSLLVSRLDLPVTLIGAEFDQVSKPADVAELGDRVAGSPLHRHCCVRRSLGRDTDQVIGSKRASSCAPAGYRFPREVIAVAVRWCLRYGLSYRDVEELLAERASRSTT